MISRFVLAALLSLSVFSGPVWAATFIQFNGSTGVFGNDLVDTPTFSDTIDLGTLTPGIWRISATISSTYQDGAQAAQDIDFTGVTLNGTPFEIGSIGQNEFRFVNNVLSQGSNLFSISGTSGTGASYSGTINIASVPEPATWAFILSGFAAVGLAMRKPKRRVRRIA
jgi:hypothetical protein